MFGTRAVFGKFDTQRIIYPWKKEMEKIAWRSLHAEMMEFFNTRPFRDSSVTVNASSWPKFACKEKLVDEGFIPAIIWKHGLDRKVLIRKADLLPIAFDDGPDAHISNLFKGRLFNIAVDNTWLEPCVVSEYKAHPVNKDVSFVKFARQVEGVEGELEIPITLTGLFGCPSVLSGGTVDLRMPTVKVVCSGYNVPPPFLVDCSRMKLGTRVLLSELALPQGCHFSRKYKSDVVVVESFDHRTVEERKLPLNYQDPNFIRPSGKKYHLNYSGFWPKQ